MGSRYIFSTICTLALACQSMGQATDTLGTAYADKNLTFAGLQVRFRSEPKGRGTVGIMLSCVATFLFCIWGTVHPNIIVGAKSFYRLFYKAVLMLIAIVVPEGLILCAFAQYREAKELHTLWLEKYPCEKEPWYSALRFWDDSKSTFGMEGAFFVIMGGFVVGLPSGPSDGEGQDRAQSISIDQTKNGEQATVTPRPGDQKQIILTAVGFKHYMKHLIHRNTMNFHRQSILDKGKSSNMAKLLAALQALWLTVQSIARLQARLAISLLEIHVAIQVACTMVIFFCWWSKPLDVNHHLVITLEREYGGASPNALGQAHLEQLQAEMELRAELEDLKSEEDKLKENRKSNIAVNPRGQRFILKQMPTDLTGITAKAFYDICSCLASSDGKSHWKTMGAEASLIVLIGALHATAWNFPFPVQLARVMWRAGSIGMCVLPTLAVLIASITAYQVDLATIVWEIHLGNPKNEKKRHLWGAIKAVGDQLLRVARRHGHLIDGNGIRRREQPWGSVMTFLHYLLIWVVLLLLVAYATSIISITNIAFVSLRSLPVGSFNTPRWSDYWPHF